MKFVILGAAIIFAAMVIDYLRNIARAVGNDKKDDEAKGYILYHYRVVIYWEQNGKAGFLPEHFWTFHEPTSATILDWTRTLKKRYDASYVAIVNWQQIYEARTESKSARDISYEIECDAINTDRNVNWR